MNSLIGQYCVALGTAASLLGVVLLAVGLRTGNKRMLRQGPALAVVALLAAIGAFAIMEWALISRDFTVEYVSQQGSSRTPMLYNIAALWSALEGSILLWVLILAFYTVLIARKFSDRLTDPMVGWALLTMLSVSTFFFALLLGPASPFGVFDPPTGFDGPGPDPLLQNHPLALVHPPMLYLGYVGFTVPFAFAIGALVTGRVGEGWLIATRRWTLVAWGFLTLGIILGAWWSYEVLGWGGYWAWDPVENASLLPWLTATAYLHSVMIQERRAMLRVWNLSLVCATFALTILGTFITRSGVIASVHAFADGTIGPILLGFFAVIVAVTVGLIGWRGDKLRAPGRIDSPLSREGAFLANNLVFAGFAFVVLLGTVWPLVVEAYDNRQISVGEPYFDQMTMPLGMVLLFLMAVAPVLPWRKASTEVLSKRLMWPGWVGTATVVVAVALGAHGIAPIIGFGLAGFAGGAALRQLVLATRRQGWRGLVGRTNGGMVVHIGVIIIAVAFVASQSYSREAEFTLDVGDTATLAGHEFTYLGTEIVELDEKRQFRASVQVNGGQVHHPAISEFLFSGRAIGEPSVESGFTGDLFLTLGARPESLDDPVTIRVILMPLAPWLWTGGAIMGLGTLLSLFPGRRRDPLLPTSAPLDLTARKDRPAEPELEPA
jgi:cytochrome c-type biogenesis protein CcmF